MPTKPIDYAVKLILDSGYSHRLNDDMSAVDLFMVRLTRSFEDLSRETKINGVRLRDEISRIWQIISTQDPQFIRHFVNESLNVLNQQNKFFIDFNLVAEVLNVDKNNIHFIRDLLKVYQLKIKSPEDPSLYMIKRKDHYYISKNKSIVIKPTLNRSGKKFKTEESIKKCYQAFNEDDSICVATKLKMIAKELGRFGEVFIDRLGLSDNGHESKSLLESGIAAGGITRERVRQICHLCIKKIEAIDLQFQTGPIRTLTHIFEESYKQLIDSNETILNFTDIVNEHPALYGFKGNELGLYVLAKLINIENIYRKHGLWYILNVNTQEDVMLAIKKYHKNIRLNSKKEKMDNVIVPVPMNAFLDIKHNVTETKEKTMNDFYLETVFEFIENKDIQPEKLKTIDWADKDNQKLVNIRFKPGHLEKVDTFSKKLSSKNIRVSRCNLLFNAFLSKYSQVKSL